MGSDVAAGFGLAAAFGFFFAGGLAATGAVTGLLTGGASMSSA
jgi:hypothetical protein